MSYLTDARADLQEKGRVIFGPNYERLLQLKKMYDPNNVFSKANLQVEPTAFK